MVHGYFSVQEGEKGTLAMDTACSAVPRKQSFPPHFNGPSVLRPRSVYLLAGVLDRFNAPPYF